MNRYRFFRLTSAIVVFIMTIGISNYSIAQDIHINTNTTWSTTQNPTGNVIISDGVTLNCCSQCYNNYESE